MVITFTIETELLAFAQAAKKAFFANQLLRKFGVTFKNLNIKFWYNNI